jgi:hypothetical protein
MGEAVHDPQRHFGTGNYCTANGLFDYFVGPLDQRGRHLDVERLRSLQVDNKLERR